MPNNSIDAENMLRNLYSITIQLLVVYTGSGVVGAEDAQTLYVQECAIFITFKLLWNLGVEI